MAKGLAVNGGRLRELREARKLNQTRLGVLAGVATPTISRIENGHPATPETVEKLAKVLETDPGWLFETLPGDVRLGQDDLLLGWVDFIEGKTSELRKAVNDAKRDELPMAKAFKLSMAKAIELQSLHDDIENYAGRRLGLVRGDSKIALALEEMIFVVKETYKAYSGNYPDSVKIVNDISEEVEADNTQAEGGHEIAGVRSA